MLYNNMGIYYLMVHDHQVKQIRLKRKIKHTTCSEAGTSKGRFEIPHKPKIKKRFSNQVPSNFLRVLNDTVSSPRSQIGRTGD